MCKLTVSVGSPNFVKNDSAEPSGRLAAKAGAGNVNLASSMTVTRMVPILNRWIARKGAGVSGAALEGEAPARIVAAPNVGTAVSKARREKFDDVLIRSLQVSCVRIAAEHAADILNG